MTSAKKIFEQEKNRKAAAYTLSICAFILLMFFLISWKDIPPSEPVVQDLMEINLGNDADGFGDEQPLVKGEPGPAEPVAAAEQPTPQQQQDVETPVTPDDNAELTAAPVVKAEKKTPIVKKTNEPVPVTKPAVSTPARPKLVYNTPTGKATGNNSTEDNGYKYQGNTKGGTGDNGTPTGNKDSYGNTPGGKVGGPRVINGNRTVVKYYSFTADLPKATIYALINVSPSGKGSFVKLVKPSTSFSGGYATAIQGYLGNMEFSKGNDESSITVQFNFTVQ